MQPRKGHCPRSFADPTNKMFPKDTLDEIWKWMHPCILGYWNYHMFEQNDLFLFQLNPTIVSWIRTSHVSVAIAMVWVKVFTGIPSSLDRGGGSIYQETHQQQPQAVFQGACGVRQGLRKILKDPRGTLWDLSRWSPLNRGRMFIQQKPPAGNFQKTITKMQVRLKMCHFPPTFMMGGNEFKIEGVL